MRRTARDLAAMRAVAAGLLLIWCAVAMLLSGCGGGETADELPDPDPAAWACWMKTECPDLGEFTPTTQPITRSAAQ